ncbi:MAG TPA: hypothetical protein IGS40_01765 [Trichormus sp. M33_DOE_039]|nr:hypothetical protein [Trichormus sp. M33_DOE_039]
MTAVATTEETFLRVHQSPTAGNPPTGLDSPQRTASPMPNSRSSVLSSGKGLLLQPSVYIVSIDY